MELLQHNTLNRHQAPEISHSNQRAGRINVRPPGPVAKLALVATVANLIPQVGAQCVTDLGAQCVEQGLMSQGLGLLAGAIAWTVTGLCSVPAVVWGGVMTVVMSIVTVAWNVLGVGFALVGLAACAILAYAVYQGIQQFAAVRAQTAGMHQAVRDDVAAVRDGVQAVRNDAVQAFQGARQVVQNNPLARVAVYTSVAAYTITAGAVALLIVGGLIRTGGVFVAGCIKTAYTLVKNVVLLIVDTVKSVCKIAWDVAALFGRVIKFGAEIAYDGLCIVGDGARTVGRSVKSLLVRDVQPATLELPKLNLSPST
jgi:hypothetical protein